MRKMVQLALGTAVMLAAGSSLFAVVDPLKPENWQKQFSCSGELKISVEETEKAVRFLAAWPDSTQDRWLYPGIALTPEDRTADTLCFEIRAVQNPAGRGYKNTLVIFVDAEGRQLGSLDFPAPGEKYTLVTLPLEGRLTFPLSDVAMIRIGLNNRDGQEAVMFLRNLLFLKQKK